MPRLGEQHHNAKLTAQLVQVLRCLYWRQGVTISELRRLYRVNETTMFDAVTYNTWVKVPDTFESREIVR